MVFMHDSPAALQLSKPDGQSKIQGPPLHLLGWVYALHVRKCERDLISSNYLQPLDVECNWLGLTGIKEPPSVRISREPA